MAHDSPKYPMPVADFAQHVGSQRKAARMLGVADPTLSLWISRGRQIFVLPGPDGAFTYYEIRSAA